MVTATAMEGDPNVGSSSSSAIKKTKKPSEVWKEMRKYRDGDGNEKAECNHCRKSFDGSSKKGTTHLRNHLNRCRANPKRKGPGGRDGDDQDQSLSPSIKTKELASLIKKKPVRCLIKHLSNTEGDTSDEEGEDWVPSVLDSRKDEILRLYQEEKEKLCQFLKNISCRFSLLLTSKNSACGYFLLVYYIDDSWERQSKFIRFWQWPLNDTEDLIEAVIEAVKQACLDGKIDRNICSLLLSINERGRNLFEKMGSWFSQRGSLPFGGCPTLYLKDYVDLVLHSKNYVKDVIQSLMKCSQYLYHKKSTSDKLIQLHSDVKLAISGLRYGPSLIFGYFSYFKAAVDMKEAIFMLEHLNSDFRSINLTKQKWDEVTATFEHLKYVTVGPLLESEKCEIPIIVDLPYVHKILKDRCNHPVEDCLFCNKVMKGAIEYLSKYYLVRVIAVILDPRRKMDGLQLHYKEIYGSDADRYLEKVNKDFRDVYDAYAATDSCNSKSYEMLDAMGRPCTTSSQKSELDLYMKELKVPAVQQFDILAWWRGNAPFYPTLARMARDYLALEKPCFVDGLHGDLDEMMMDLEYFDFEDEDVREIILPLVNLKGFLSSVEN